MAVIKPAKHRDVSPAPSENALLAALSRQGLKRLQPHLEYVPLPLGTPVYGAGRPSAHLYFPANGIISMLHGMENGAVGEIAVVGNEGVVGMAMFISGTTSRALVKSAGIAYRIEQVALKEEFERGGELHDLLLRYTQALVSQIVQTAVCTRRYSVDQQFFRTLLMSLELVNAYIYRALLSPEHLRKVLDAFGDLDMPLYDHGGAQPRVLADAIATQLLGYETAAERQSARSARRCVRDPRLP